MTEKKPILLIHDRPVCIGCAACVGVAPDFWVMNKDGRSDIKHCRKEGDKEYRDLSEDELPQNMDAAELCPVNCIHVEKEGKRVI